MSKEIHPESGGAYREARLRSGFTQESLARAAKVSRRHIIKIERGWHLPHRKTRDKLAKALGVDPTSLPAAGEDPFVPSEMGGVTLSRFGFNTRLNDWFARRLK